jgi:HEAT repeat protein
MTVTGALTVALFVITSALVLLTLTVAAGHAIRTWYARRMERLAEQFTPLVIRLVNEDEIDEEAMRGLVGLTARQWTAARPVATRMLDNLRGPARARLVDLFEQRGVTTQAIRDTRRHLPGRRARAAEILGQLKHTPAVPELRRLLQDRDRDVRQVAARALGRIGDPAAALPLLETLGGDRPVPKHIVAQAVLRLGPPAVPALAAAVDHTDTEVREVAIETLGMAGGYQAASGIVEALRYDVVTDVRVRAARALGKLGLPSSIPALLDATKTGEPAVRAEAVQALADLGADVVPRMRELLGDPAYSVARAAARALLTLGPPGREALTEVAETDTRAAVVANEALAIAALGAQLGIRQTGLQAVGAAR